MTFRRDFEWEHDAHDAMDRGGWDPETPKPRAFVDRQRRLAAMIGREPYDPDRLDPRWHISLQHFERIPLWEEVVVAAHELRPGVPFVVGVPPRSWWMNVHPRVLHLIETTDVNLLARWQLEGQGHTPSGAERA